MADVRRERIPLVWSTVRERAWPKVLVLTWRIRSIRLSAEEQSVCSVFCLGSVTNQELEGEVAHNHICVP